MSLCFPPFAILATLYAVCAYKSIGGMHKI
nr:MAG TPA: hypothetical protein [Caudoviricetes sp.]